MKPSVIVGLVARREIRERVRSRVFIVSTLIGAGIVVALIVIPSFNKGEVKTYDVALVNVTDPVIRAAASNAGVVANAKVRIKDYTDIAVVRAGVREGSIDIALVDARTIIVGDPPPEGRITDKSLLIAAISESARLQTALTDAGLSADTAAAALQAAPLPIDALGEPNQPSQEEFTNFVGVIAIFIFFQQYGGWILVGVAEEKSSRIAEVLLAAVKPRQLVAGKILGIGSVGLVQALFVASSAIVASRVVGSDILAGTQAFEALAAVGWFVLGFSFYGWAFAAAGSLVSRPSEASSASLPVMIPILAGYIATITATGQSDASAVLKILAYFPPTTPMCMPTLMSLEQVAPWQVGASIAGVLISALVMARVAGAIYSNAILRAGKRVKWIEALRAS